MRATINQKGVLVVTPESELEAYAVKAWSSHFPPFQEPREVRPMPPPGALQCSTLLIEAFNPDQLSS